MRENACSLPLSVLTAIAAATLCASTAEADPPCGLCPSFSNNAAYQFNPTGNNPNVPRGLVGSGYYGAYSPDGYHHSACVADFGAGYHDNIADYNVPAFTPTSGYHLTGQSGQIQTTNYRPNAPSTNGAAQPAAPIRRQYGWW
jgi:hypothetical protein